MKKLLLPFLAVFMFIGCSTEPCEKNYTFSMEFTNSTGDSYDLYINGRYQEVMTPGERVVYDIPAGYWTAEVEQITGYSLFPTVRQYDGNYQPCTDYFIVL